jgi:mitochondrial Rho GTPase 1
MDATVNVLRIEECSARDDSAMAVLEFACDASLHPIMPIYNHVAKRMRCRAVRALNRIFDLCDEDKNGALSSDELRKFHLFAYGQVVTDDELRQTRQARLLLLTSRRC